MYLCFFFFTYIGEAIGRQGWFVAAIIGLGIRFPFPTAAFAIARRDVHPQPRLLKYARIELAMPDMIGPGVLRQRKAQKQKASSRLIPRTVKD